MRSSQPNNLPDQLPDYPTPYEVKEWQAVVEECHGVELRLRLTNVAIAIGILAGCGTLYTLIDKDVVSITSLQP